MARKVNPMLAGIEARNNRKLRAAQDFFTQYCADMMLIAANEALGCGPKRLRLLFETFCAAYAEYADILAEGQKTDKDFNYLRGKLDRKLEQIMGEHFQPWEQRYGN